MKLAFTPLEVLVSLTIIVTLLAGLIIPGCTAIAEANKKASIILICFGIYLLSIISWQIRQNPDKVEKSFYLHTEQHDGHTWVMNRTMDYLLHHPDCPCHGKVEKD